MPNASDNSAQSHKTATDLNALKLDESAKVILHTLYHSIDRKHSFLYVKFGVWLLFSLARKSLFKQKVSFFMDDGPSISQNAEFKNAWEIFLFTATLVLGFSNRGC